MNIENLDLKSRKGHYTLAIAVCLMFGIFLFFFCCNGGSSTTTVTIPAVSGTMEIVKPKNNPIVINANKTANMQKSFGQNLSNYDKSEYDKLQKRLQELMKENESLDNAFQYANDSLQQVIYRQAIQLNAFTHTWDNDTLKATVSGISRGVVQSIKLDYTIKERKQEIKVPVTVFRLLAGGGYGLNKEMNQSVIKVNLGIQNKKGNVIRASVEKIGEQQFYIAEYDFSIFSLKR